MKQKPKRFNYARPEPKRRINWGEMGWWFAGFLFVLMFLTIMSTFFSCHDEHHPSPAHPGVRPSPADR